MADVKVQDKTPRKEYTATAGQTVFPYDFVIFDEDDLEVFQEGSLLTITTDYTVSGVGAEGGGNVTLTSGATVGDSIIISREVPFERLTQYTVGGDFRAEILGREQSKEIAMLQQLKRDIDRVLTFDVTATGITAGTLPIPQDDRTILFDGTTGSMKIGPTASNIENAETFANQAEQAKDDAEAAFDAFDDRNLGPKASDPTVDNDGDPLQAGTYYFNTTDNVVRVYNGTSWQSVTTPISSNDLATDVFSGLTGTSTIADADVLPFYDDSDGVNKKITKANLLPDASQTVKGLVEIATQSEVDGRSDSVRAVTPATLKTVISETAVSLSGNSSVNFTGLPSGISKITFMLYDVSTTGSNDVILRLGGSSGIATSGYDSNGGFLNEGSNGIGTFASAFIINAYAASETNNLIAEIVRFSGNKWVSVGSSVRPNGYQNYSGRVDLGEELTQLQVSLLSGTFDSGEVNITYEL